jgi:predicted acyl esterase
MRWWALPAYFALFFAGPPVHAQAERVSRFGEYRGFSPRRFDSFVRESRYVPVKDGTRIALDIYRPASGGSVATERLPVALYVTRYWRSSEIDYGSIRAMPGLIPPGRSGAPLLDPSEYRSERGWAVVSGELLRHGYTIVAMDSRGTGVSFGVQTPLLEQEARDMSDIIEWAAKQPWSSGKVGMFGASWPGIIQLIAAMAKPEHLAAIFPAVPNFPDLYRIFRPGGVYGKGAALTMRKTLVSLSDVKDKGQTGSNFGREFGGKKVVGPAHVDDDKDGSERAQARSGHGAASFSGYVDDILNHPTVKEVAAELGLTTIDQIINTLFYSDSLDRALVGHDSLRRKLARAQWPVSPLLLDLPRKWLQQMNASGIPTYLWDGWQDPAPTERLLYFYNLTVPTRLTVGPWSHGAGEPNDPREDAHLRLMGTELVRWFDFWLRGIPNGIDREPRVNYAVMEDKARWEWRSAPTIPPPEAVPTELYFGPGPSGSVRSPNDGTLERAAGRQSSARDDYTADYGLSTGNHTRLHDATGAGPIDYPDLAPNDARALTYTTPPLERAVAFAGFPVVTLHLSSTSEDPSLVVYLEDVEPSGRSTLVTQGFLRASHRTPGTPSYSTNGTPWTSSVAKDVEAAAPLTHGPATLAFALHPAANRFAAGHRIRVTIAMSDEGVIWVIPESPRPVITVWRDSAHPSRLTLPVLP